MTCSSPERELLTFWLAGTLDPDESRAVSQHLEGCADCRAGVGEGRVLIDGLRQLHLTADEVVAAAADALTLPHLLVCSRCRDEVALLRAVNTELATASGRPARSWQWRILGVAAAAAAILIGAFLLAPPPRNDDHTTLRGSSTALVDGLIATIGPDAVPAFAWTPVDGATSYRIAVFSADGQPVWSRQVGAPPVTWPAEVPRTPGSYRWNVAALAGATAVARSRLTDLNIPR